MMDATCNQEDVILKVCLQLEAIEIHLSQQQHNHFVFSVYSMRNARRIKMRSKEIAVEGSSHNEL
jgi:hypothetical protein